jgi:Flp pilus assembly CpaF family ATPase
VAPLGLRVDESSPWVDARLSDGSRVQTQLLSAPFLPSQGPPAAAVSCLVSIEYDVATVCRKGTLSANLVTLFRRSAGPAPSIYAGPQIASR